MSEDIQARLSTKTWLSIIGVSFTILMTSGGMLWRMAQMAERVEKNRSEIKMLEDRVLPELRADIDANKAFAIRATQQLESIKDTQDKMHGKIDRLLQRR